MKFRESALKKIFRGAHFSGLVYGLALLVQVQVHVIGIFGYMFIGRPTATWIMATHEHGKWVFNPPGSQLVKGGTALVLMASPDARAHLEKTLKG